MKFISFILFTIGSISLFAQNNILSELSGFQNGRTIQIRCTVKQGNQCLGIDVLRSADGNSFENIGRIPGVCGDPTVDLQYTFIDSQPLINTTNYYKVKPGNLGESEAIEVEFYDTFQRNYIVINDPQLNTIKIIFSNPSKEDLNLKLFSIQGRLIFTQKLNENYINIKKSSINEKIVIFSINNETYTLIRGKFIL